MKKMFLLFQILLCYNLQAQVHQVTGGFVTSSGASTDIISLNYSAGQITTLTIDQNIKANIGILQYIPNLLDDVEDSLLNDINVYPNPISEILRFDLPCGNIFQVEIFDMSFRKMLKTESLICNDQINLAVLESGVYILKLSQNQDSRNIKVIKL